MSYQHCLAALFLMVSSLSIADAGEPEVAFKVNDGWLEFTVTQAAEPVPEVAIVVFDQQGNRFATGETSRQGYGEFPLPPGDFFFIEFTVHSRTADRITLTKVEQDCLVVPKAVQLTFGLAPCCQVWDRYSTHEVPPNEDHGALPRWARALIAIVGLFGGLILLGRTWWQRNKST